MACRNAVLKRRDGYLMVHYVVIALIYASVVRRMTKIFQNIFVGRFLGVEISAELALKISKIQFLRVIYAVLILAVGAIIRAAFRRAFFYKVRKFAHRTYGKTFFTYKIS